MRTKEDPRFMRYLVCVAAMTFALGVFADYAVDWYTLDGGGATSTGGVFAVSGTTGQPDSGGMLTGGPYSVTGGFWVLPLAIQTEGAPTLFITRGEPGMAVISWASSSTNWVLQEKANLISGEWSDAPSGQSNPAVVPAVPPTKCYRLFNPTAP